MDPCNESEGHGVTEADILFLLLSLSIILLIFQLYILYVGTNGALFLSYLQ